MNSRSSVCDLGLYRARGNKLDVLHLKLLWVLKFAEYYVTN